MSAPHLRTPALLPSSGSDSVGPSAVHESLQFLHNYCTPAQQTSSNGSANSSGVPPLSPTLAKLAHVPNSIQLNQPPSLLAAAPWFRDGLPPQPAQCEQQSPVPAALSQKSSFVNTIATLRARYATDKSGEAVCGLETMTDDDVAALVDCFRRDLEAAVAAARAKASGRGSPTQPPKKLRSNTSAALTATAPSNAASFTAESTNDVMSSSIHNVREAMTVLRSGTLHVKFSSRSGKPSVRHVRVMDRRAVHGGEMVLMPHLCWSTSAAEEPSNQLPLIELVDVRTGPSKDAAKNANGYVVDTAGNVIRDARCFSAVFSQRRVNLAAPSEAVADLWVKCLLMVVERNRTLRTHAKHR